ncbi:hypothetical protein ACWGIB_27915 [Streptomyces xiamenensis]
MDDTLTVPAADQTARRTPRVPRTPSSVAVRDDASRRFAADALQRALDRRDNGGAPAAAH